MKDLLRGILKLCGSLFRIVIALPLAVPIAAFLVTLEPVARFYNLMLYYIDRFISVFM